MTRNISHIGRPQPNPQGAEAAGASAAQELLSEQRGNTRMDKDRSQLSREEWDFLTCSNWELEECWHYEFKRESPRVCQIIVNWRNVYKTPSFDELLRLAQAMLMPPERGHLYALCPEWPTYPYLSIPLAERERRFSQLFPDPRKSLAAELEPTPAAPGDLSVEALNFIRELLGCDVKTQENVTFRIPWRMADKEITRRFAAWLKIHRRIRASINVSNRVLGADLKALGALRTLRVNEDWSRGPEIYLEQSEWTKARKRAQKIIQAIESRWT